MAITTVIFMSVKYPTSFAVEDEVVERLLERAKSGNNASQYVNSLLKWALENYKDEVRNDVAEQVPNG